MVELARNSVNKARVYHDMGRDLDTGVGHTTPPSFWETLQNFSPTQPLGAVAGAMALGAVGVSMMGRNLIPEAQQRTPEQMNAINRLRTIQPRVGRERILERGGRVDRYDDMPELGDVATGLIRTSARGESSAQTIQGQQLTPPTEGNPAQTLVPESRAGEFRERELGLGRPLAKFKEKYPAGSISGRTPPQTQALSRTTSTSSNIMGLDLASRGQELTPQIEERVKFNPDDWRDRVAQRQERRERNIETPDDIRERGRFGRRLNMLRATSEAGEFKPIDIPHSHEQELALERAGRVQREGQYLVPETPVVRPSTTLTETLIQARQNVADNMEMMREMRGIQEEMDRLMGRMNEPRGDDI